MIVIFLLKDDHSLQIMSLFIITPGFGGPHIEEKVEIMAKNLSIIQSYPWVRWKWTVCAYDAEVMGILPHILHKHPNIEWVTEPGIVGQYICRHATREHIQDYDYVMMILDDVELQDDVIFEKIISYDRTFRFDIYSPCMTLSSKYQFNYMLVQPENPAVLKVTSACEAFCYIMRRDSFLQWQSFIDPDKNPWLWGLDMCIQKCLGLKCAILNQMRMHHHYKGECYALRPDCNPCDGYNSVIERFGVTSEELADQRAVLYWIFESP